MNRRSLMLGGAAILLSGCNEDKPPVPIPHIGNLSMAADKWNILYSPSMPPHPAPHGEGWAFDFDAAPTGVDYVVQPLSGSIAGKTLNIDFHIDGNGELKPTEGEASPRARLFFSQRGDNLSGAGPYEFFRWWSTVYVELVPGDHSMLVPMAPSQWSSVYGKHGDEALVGFAGACADIGSVGITFGGTFAGHGVKVVPDTGPSKFICDRYWLT